jgi:transposase-like protein
MLFPEDRMNVHKNARLMPCGRERIVRQVESGQTPKAVGLAAGVCPRTVRKWVDRYRREGLPGLRDRGSRPHRLHRPTPQAVVTQVEALRRARRTGKQIASELCLSPASVSRILKRLGLNRIGALEPANPVRRYERAKPGEMIHIDIKKLGRFNKIGHRITGDRKGQSNNRGVGWECVHVAIDDYSRIAFAKVMPNEKMRSAIAFLKAALAYYKSGGLTKERPTPRRVWGSKGDVRTVETKSEQYRRYAQQCLEIAQSTADERAQASLVQMAQVWFRLAQNAETGDAESSDEN